MAESTFEERLTRLEEQFKALQALTVRLAAWELGGTGTLDLDTAEPERTTASDRALVGLPAGESAERPRRLDR
jgi:hypothetical protein